MPNSKTYSKAISQSDLSAKLLTSAFFGYETVETLTAVSAKKLGSTQREMERAMLGASIRKTKIILETKTFVRENKAKMLYTKQLNLNETGLDV